MIAGPTASGKSALAMAVADLHPSIIVNADSMQVYRDLNVVTARPPPADEARHPHALFGHLDGAQACSAADWAAQARDAIAAARLRGRLPILVGGTGLYLRTLLDGIAPIPPIDPAVREAVRALPVAAAHAALTVEDPDAARRFAPADTTRVARALEVIRSTGRPIAHWQRELTGGIGASVRVVPLILAPDREELSARIDRRFDEMLRDGQGEVAALMARELNPQLPVMRAIGVREIAAMLRGETDAAAARTAGALASRRYAKRQATWFANSAPPHWRRVTGTIDEPDLAAMLARDALARPPA